MVMVDSGGKSDKVVVARVIMGCLCLLQASSGDGSNNNDGGAGDGNDGCISNMTEESMMSAVVKWW
jgi:hypothetical protein